MLVNAAIGDSVGCSFEYAPKEWVDAHNDGETYWEHPKYPERGKGRFSDDTQLATGIAEIICTGINWSRLNIANKFVEVFKRDERTGYSKGFYNLLKSVKDGYELLGKIIPNSERSGSAMRAFPIGMYPNIYRVKTLATIQSLITHDTPDGIAASVASALTLHYFCYKLGPHQYLPQFIKANVNKINGPDWDIPYKEEVGEKGWMSVQAAITALSICNTTRDILQYSIGLTGDVDTSSTIALGAGSFAKDIKQNLPQSLYDGLENGKYGKDYLKELDQKLIQKFSDYLPI